MDPCSELMGIPSPNWSCTVILSVFKPPIIDAGDSVGCPEGNADGRTEGSPLGIDEGICGCLLGCEVGYFEGCDDG